MEFEANRSSTLRLNECMAASVPAKDLLRNSFFMSAQNPVVPQAVRRPGTQLGEGVPSLVELVLIGVVL